MGDSWTWVDMLIEYYEDSELELHLDYSGRFMLGRRCVGVSGEFHSLMGLLLDIARVCGEEDIPAPPVPQTDNFGLGMIWYWPNISRADINHVD